MSIAELSSSIQAGCHRPTPASPDADFDQRWTAWKARGLARGHVVQRRFIVVAIAAGTIALGAVIADGPLFW